MTAKKQTKKALVVRTIEAAEVEDWTESMYTGFLAHPAEGEAQYRLGDMDLSRTWGAFDGAKVVGTLRSFPTPLTMPGPNEIPSAALTNVTVAPTHRRQGLLTRMITNDLRDSADRGEPVGILIASEYPIYGQFGYGHAIDAASYRVDATKAQLIRPGLGTVEMVDLVTLRREAPAIYERVRAHQPGAIGRTDRWWDATLEQVEVPGAKTTKGYQAICRGPDGEVDGYVRYTAAQEWDDFRPKGTLTVTELVAATPDAYLRLWRYCCEVDLITRVQASDRSIHEPLVWLLRDGRSLRQTGRFDFLWVRVLDVAATLAGRRYATEGRLVIEVTDPLGIAAGRFALEGGPTGATCAPTQAGAELTLGISTLGSLSMGGVSALALADSGRIDELAAGALARADAMFHSAVTPWCSTWF